MPLPYNPEPQETFWLRRLICHPWFPVACIVLALLIVAANLGAL